MSTFLFSLLQLLDLFYFNLNFFFRSSAIELKICAITAGTRKYKPIIMKMKKNHDKIVLFAKSKLNSTEVLLIFKASIDWVINHDEFVLRNNVLKEYNQMKEQIKNFKT